MIFFKWGQNSSVCLITVLHAGQRGIVVRFQLVARVLWKLFRLALVHTQPLAQKVPDTVTAGLKRPMCEAGHKPTPTATVRNKWSYAFTALYAFIFCTRKILPP
jgi:hypothetical protein